MTQLMRIRPFFPVILFATIVLFAGCDSGGTPGAGTLGDSTSVAFDESEALVGEDAGTYTVSLSVADAGFKEVPVSVSFNTDQSSVTRGDDISASSDTTIRFPRSATSGDERSFGIEVLDDDEFSEGTETAVFDLSIPDSVEAAVGAPSQFSLSIEDNDEAPPSFDLLADAQDLEPSSGNTDAHCLVQRSSGEVVFFNSSDGGIFSYDGGLNVERTATDLNSDIAAESNPIDRCDGVARDESDNVYFLLRSDESSSQNSHPTYVYKLASSGSASVLASEQGLKGIVHSGSTVYLTGVSFRGASGDGFYSVNDTDESQSVSTLATESALDLAYGMDIDSSGNLYAFSGGFASGDRTRKIVRLVNPSGSATIEEFADPYRDGSPLVGDSGDDIADVDVVSRDGAEFLVVYNGSFEANNGEQWASIQISDQSISLLFNRTQLVENSPAGGFVGGFTEPVAVNDNGEIFVASREAFFGGEYYIARVENVLP
ncbi:hypothetical protein [Salinibacter ruber]|uniref:hypothetical protein n=2 Tax=Salinibacter ruber TaxID=146919 RepID=UPI0021695CB2|nr:hypothetical protein [Salinibacter ruber]